jgi:hypothetical protein
MTMVQPSGEVKQRSRPLREHSIALMRRQSMRVDQERKPVGTATDVRRKNLGRQPRRRRAPIPALVDGEIVLAMLITPIISAISRTAARPMSYPAGGDGRLLRPGSDGLTGSSLLAARSVWDSRQLTTLSTVWR